jgi:hypothetical protein
MSWRTEKKARQLRERQEAATLAGERTLQAARLDQLEAERKQSQITLDMLKKPQRPVYEGAQSTKPGLEEIFERTRQQYGYGGGGGGSDVRGFGRQYFVKNIELGANRLGKQYQFEQWSRYEEPKTYGGIKTIIEDHTPPAPVPQGKTLDELFAEDDE